MADLQYSPNNLLLVMDCLWFHQIILFSSELISLPSLKLTTTTPKVEPITKIGLNSESDLSLTPPSEENISEGSSDTSPTSPKEDNLVEDTDAEDEEEVINYYNYKRKRPTSLTLISSKSRSHSSSPSVHKLPKHLRNIGAKAPLLRKAMSCRSLFELEYEEVKGFMDLGFTFKKEQLSSRMMSVIPGLQRLDEYKDGPEGHCINAKSEEMEENDIEELDRVKNGVK
ncbi:hypothetical protein IFM89_000498 [Coptis chinensis]|uniref:Uncharacterized protein n=1 Tax=Coptis chinensis TaxID=261450 RepID=A0A835H5E4_9MAGN|nr:hypothetical protein IFM89_000498 [Coptis chinensis]